ncbi:MAG: hypothetical protein MR425_00465 [Lachnospiraceae bacterium]|nr:hypothetical protein [Lachnospiraceae bacterium]
MKKKTYRLCLLSLVVIALIGGFFYYRSHQTEDSKEVDGTFVKHGIEQVYVGEVFSHVYGKGSGSYGC